MTWSAVGHDKISFKEFPNANYKNLKSEVFNTCRDKFERPCRK